MRHQELLRAEAKAREYLTKTFVPLLEAKKAAYQLELVRSSTDNDAIGSVICKRAEQINASAIILCKHSKNAVKEFFVGSVTNYLIHHSKNPVVLLHE